MNAIYPLTLYYDGACQMCRAEMRNLELRDTSGLLRFVDITDLGFDEYPLGTTREAMLTVIHAMQADGNVLRGVEVFRLAYSAVGLPWVARLTRLPLLGVVLEAIYPWVARNRYRLPSAPIRWLFEISLRRAAERSIQRSHCDGGQCRVEPVIRSQDSVDRGKSS
jgi:predicted DCC family thiol-disulfide oxidoreductase YuxK